MPADEGRKRRSVTEEDGDELALPAAVASTPKETKKRRKLKYFLFFTLLLAGLITGLHNSGIIDVRPFIWTVVPKIPFIGDYLKGHLEIPEVYTLTVEERRKLELKQWQERLDAKERGLLEKVTQLESSSGDIAAKQQRIDKKEAELLAKESDIKIRNEATPEEEALIKELTGTYQEISPRRSAQIMAQLPDHLAVELMKNLPHDARASILSRMDPRRAARLTENLANPPQ
ncbi:MAG: MgtE intracellular region [Synergistaceae bacterium]|nr:MgtE intracellular region [Synergistaceae bacterium]